VSKPGRAWSGIFFPSTTVNAVAQQQLVLLQILAALFHFNQHDGFPNVIGERGAATVLVGFTDAEFGFAANVQ
jgi:hypothetical protein